MLEKLFESLDEKVFTPEVIAELQESINAMVEEKSQEKAETIVAEKLTEMEVEFTAKLEEAKTELSVAQTAEYAVLAETVQDYMLRSVEDFVTEAKVDMAKSTEELKAKALIEAFEAMILVSGIDIMKIQEAKDEAMVESKLDEVTSKYDALMTEHLDVKRKMEESLKLGIIAELSEGLTMLESEKFRKAAEVVSYSAGSEYVDSLKILAETAKSAVTEVIDESVKEKKDEPSWQRFV